jgi:hypothetical protein
MKRGWVLGFVMGVVILLALGVTYDPELESFFVQHLRLENLHYWNGSIDSNATAYFWTGITDANAAAEKARKNFGTINVKDYGATGNGVTDDTAAIAAAKAAAEAIGGATVYFPPGIYVTDTIVLSYYPKHVHYRGEGSHAVTLEALSANKPIFQGGGVAGGNGVGKQKVRGFTLKAHASGSTGPAFDLSNTGDMTIEDIGFAEHVLQTSGQWTDGFLFDASSWCYCSSVKDVRIRANNPISNAVVKFARHANAHHFSGFYITGFCQPKMAFSFPDANATDAIHHVIIENSHFEGMTTTDPAVIDVGSGNDNIVIQNCYFENVVKAFDETATSACAIYNCYFAASPGTTLPVGLPSNYFMLFNGGGQWGSDQVGTPGSASSGRSFRIIGPAGIYQDAATAGSGLTLYDSGDPRNHLQIWAGNNRADIQAGDEAGSRSLYLNATGGMVYSGSGGIDMTAGNVYATSFNPGGGKMNQWDDVNIPSDHVYKIGGVNALQNAVSHAYGSAHLAWVLTAAQARGTEFVVTGANADPNMSFPAVQAGKTPFAVVNGSGHVLTVKVAGQSGATLANTKTGLYRFGAADVVEIYEQP